MLSIKAVIITILPLFGAAIPVENNVKAILAPLGGPQVCTMNMDGTGATDNQVTKDCCHHVHQDRGIHNVYFNELEKRCMGRSGALDNAVDWGRMNECCASRGRGAHGSSTKDE